jgi:hypothetical protein
MLSVKAENQQQLPVFSLLYKEILEDLWPTLPPPMSLIHNFQSGSSCCWFPLLNTWKNSRSSADSETARHTELSPQSILMLPKYLVLIFFWDHITFCRWNTFIGKCIIPDLWVAWYHTKLWRTYLPEKGALIEASGLVKCTVKPPLKHIRAVEFRSHRKRAVAAGCDLSPRPKVVRTASSPSNRRRADAADQSRSRRAVDICVLETDLPGGQYGMAEEFTEKN